MKILLAAIHDIPRALRPSKAISIIRESEGTNCLSYLISDVLLKAIWCSFTRDHAVHDIHALRLGLDQDSIGRHSVSLQCFMRDLRVWEAGSSPSGHSVISAPMQIPKLSHQLQPAGKLQ